MDCRTSNIKYVTINDIFLETELQTYTEQTDRSRCEMLYVFQIATMDLFYNFIYYPCINIGI